MTDKLTFKLTIADAEKRYAPGDGDLRVKCLVYSRVVGYLTPVENWNKGKQAEWEERKVFKMPESED